jgi:hypothetical protein
MKDIDFDELDKAVSTLMGGTSSTDTASKQSSEPLVETPEPQQVDSKPANEDVEPSLSQPQPQRVPAQRRTGRFMDMVQTPSRPKSRVVPSSRVGVTIEPRSTEQGRSAVNDMPSEQAVVSDKESEMVSPQTPENASSLQSEDVAVPLNVTTVLDSPLESPFLSDAKVEKRPLNPGASNNALQETPSESDTESDSEEDAQDGDRSVAPQPPTVPAELSKDLVEIEAGELDANKPNSPSDTATQSPVPVGASSIAQQYREESSSGDQSHAAIFDSSEFQPVLAHPAKQKSGWLWVIWVLLLLALGAGGAVALYLTGLI